MFWVPNNISQMLSHLEGVWRTLVRPHVWRFGLGCLLAGWLLLQDACPFLDEEQRWQVGARRDVADVASVFGSAVLGAGSTFEGDGTSSRGQ